MKLAYFNPHDNNRVLQWLDTEAFDYQLPDVSLLHECTDEIGGKTLIYPK